uniref:CSON005736 protein n=1 Tax=Culicoides sonorensis TaxID=179676 RepID=A0A336LVX7_CULSO
MAICESCLNCLKCQGCFLKLRLLSILMGISSIFLFRLLPAILIWIFPQSLEQIIDKFDIKELIKDNYFCLVIWPIVVILFIVRLLGIVVDVILFKGAVIRDHKHFKWYYLSFLALWLVELLLYVIGLISGVYIKMFIFGLVFFMMYTGFHVFCWIVTRNLDNHWTGNIDVPETPQEEA